MTQIKLRRDTSANFTSKNPVLGLGEPAYETDTKKLKIGDGTTAYTQLEYFSAGGGGSADIGATLPLKIVNGVISIEVDGQTIQVVDGKLAASANMVTTDTTQNISGQKEFDKTILFLGNNDLLRAQQSTSYRNGAGLSMGANSTSTDGGVFAPQWKIYNTAGGVDRTETIVTTYNQSKLNNSNFNTANKLVRLDLDGKLPAVDGSNLTNLPGGLEVCDIGMALYIDETKGLRRYLNGQIVDINTNTQAFLNRLLEIQTTNPDYFTTEDNWQAESLLNIDGCVYKFVLNYSGDNVVSVRLPKYPDYVEINVGGTLPVVGNGMALGMTDGTSTKYTYQAVSGNNLWSRQPGYLTSKQGKVGDTTKNVTESLTDYKFIGIATDPTKSGIQTTLKQTKLKLRYFIQVATGSETENNIVNDIELNNPYSLFDSKYSDHELNNLSWLKSEGQWNAKAVYPTAYDELLTEYNNSASVNKTEGSITFKRTPKGYKIALADQETAIDTKYSTDGIAWYYILDTTNEKFKLPRTKFGFEGLRTSVGDDIEAGLPNITGYVGASNEPNYDGTPNGAFYNTGSGYRQGHQYSVGGVGFNASLSNPIYGKSNTVQSPATQMYLYFYVGETVQNANLIDAGRIGEQLATKTDMLQASGASMPSNRYIDLTLGASGTIYTAPANGWFTVAKIAGTTNKYIQIGTEMLTSITFPSSPGDWGIVNIPVKKGDKVSPIYNLTGPTQYFRFIYAEGSK